MFKFSCGVVVELVIDEETGAAVCQWPQGRLRPSLDMFDEMILPDYPEYDRWIDDIQREWVQRTGKTPPVIDEWDA